MIYQDEFRDPEVVCGIAGRIKELVAGREKPITLMEVCGYEIPEAFQGRSLFGGTLAGISETSGTTPANEEAIRERLTGLGYIS